MRVRHTIAGVEPSMAALVFAADPAQAAWSPSDAASYADRYAASPDDAYPQFTDDCTNFVSQAIRYGGHPQKGTPSGSVLADDSQWWMQGTGGGRTHSWSVAHDLETFFSVYDTHADGGHAQYSGDGSSLKNPPSPVAKGDAVFYLWDNRTGSQVNHAAILVGTGTDPDSGLSGSLVDEHSSYRDHAIWNLKPYNSPWMYTTTIEFHLS